MYNLDQTYDAHFFYTNVMVCASQALYITPHLIDIFKITKVLDIGCASGQFTLLQRLKNINAFGIDPQEYYLFSNSEDFQKNNLNPKSYLFLGDLENFTKQITNTPIKIGCVSLLNYIHGWNGTDMECLQLLESLSKHAKYLIISYPQNQPKSQEYLHHITNRVICIYNQIDIPRETHYLIELTTYTP